MLGAMLVVLAWSFVGFSFAKSAALGGVTFLIPSLYFTWRFFKYRHARQAGSMVKTMFFSEVVKLLLMGVLVVLVLKHIPVNVIAFITGLVGAQLGLWFSPLLAFKTARISQ